jgi:iron complex outermembrane receptor protein
VALILLRPKWSVRLSYSKSFVDAPYIYRKANLLSTLMGGGLASDAQLLSPERVHSLQLSFAGTNWMHGLSFEVNGFYNRATDLIMAQIIEYENLSKNQTCGVELMASYEPTRKLSLNANLTWTHTFKSNLMGLGMSDESNGQYAVEVDANNNTPALHGNLIVGWQASKQLRLHGHLLFESKQTSYNTDLVNILQGYGFLLASDEAFKQGNDEQGKEYINRALEYMRNIIMEKDMSARAIVNIGAKYQIGPVTLGLDIHNLLGTHYYRSGMNTNLIPQQGRWFICSVGIRL